MPESIQEANALGENADTIDLDPASCAHTVTKAAALPAHHLPDAGYRSAW